MRTLRSESAARLPPLHLVAREPESPWAARALTELVPPATLTEARAGREALAALLGRERSAAADFLVQARTWVTFWNRDLGDSSLRLG
jgi:hypothetical protein